jgi:hypothetical protein
MDDTEKAAYDYSDRSKCSIVPDFFSRVIVMNLSAHPLLSSLSVIESRWTPVQDAVSIVSFQIVFLLLS